MVVFCDCWCYWLSNLSEQDEIKAKDQWVSVNISTFWLELETVISTTLGRGRNECTHTHTTFIEQEWHQCHPMVQVGSGFGLACDVH